MSIVKKRLTKTFNEFFDSEKASGIILIVCTVISLALANLILGEQYPKFWLTYVGGLSIEHWINDGLMAIFFLLIGLELKRELYKGELSNFKNAMLPIFAAIGGLATPALFHYLLNRGLTTQPGIGIPMATDIAFALGVLALLGKRVPASLKVFLTAVAVMDDLGAIVVIAVFYTAEISTGYLFAAMIVFGVLSLLNKAKVMSLVPYMIGGALMWYFMLKSGVHATIAGVLLAFTIPFTPVEDDETSPSYKLEHFLHRPVAFGILPLFALANTGIVIGAGAFAALLNPNELGIIGGLILGKPFGIFLLSFTVVMLGICRLPLDLNWKHVFGAGLLGGIGFTMSIFITNLAFVGNVAEITGSKMAILVASLLAGILGFTFLKLFGQPEDFDDDMDAMDFEEDD
ncbi:MAG: Na+/H+ antiporter NhaA [Pyrinomonadaceae bacterium]|nr:Na+/H+ antiporter NhaA [Pyrinomonadaceae bacterium]